MDFRVFPFPTIINSSATHIHVQVFVSIYVLFLLGMSGISGSYGEFIFNFSRNCQTVFQNSCTILYCFHILPSTGLCLFVCCLFLLFLISFFLPSHWLLIHFLRIPFWFISRMSIWAHTQKQYLGAYFYVYLFLVVALHIIYLYNLSSSTFLSVPVNWRNFIFLYPLLLMIGFENHRKQYYNFCFNCQTPANSKGEATVFTHIFTFYSPFCLPDVLPLIISVLVKNFL